MQINKNSLVNLLMQVLIFSTLVCTIAYFFIGYLSVPYGGIEPLRDWKLIYENKILLLYAIASSILLVWLYFNIINSFKISYLIFFSICIFTLSILLNGNSPSPMFYFSILNIYVIFYVLLRSEVKFSKMSNITLWILICYMIFPILILATRNFIDITNDIPPLFVFDSFRGFTFDRIEYAIMAGYLILILTIGEKKYTSTVVPFIIYGVLLAESRAIMVALFFAYIYLYRNNLKALFFLILSILFFFLILINLSNRIELLDTDGGRFDFYIASLEQICNSFLSIFLGTGQYYTPVEKYSVVPHNLIFQSLLNFGVFTFIAWVLIIISIWNKLNNQGRAFLIYSLAIGFFHPGFDAYMFLPFSAFGYYLAVFYGLRKEDSL